MCVSHFPTQVRRKFQSGGHSAEVMNVMRLDGLEKKKVLTITLHFKQMLPHKELNARNLTYNEHYNKSSLDITMHCSRHCSANLPCRALGVYSLIWAIWGCAATQGVVFYLPVLNSILFHASLP